MESNTLPNDANTLLTLAGEIADVLAERQSDLSQDAEALLRASIAAAKFATCAYEAILSGAEDSPAARPFLVPAKARCDRTVEQLRRRLAKSIAEVCGRMDVGDLYDVAEYVLSISG